MGDVDPEVVRGIAGVGAPDAVQDLAVGQDLSSVGDEQAQQGVFDGG